MTATFDPSALKLYAITADGSAMDRRSRHRVRLWLEAGVRTIQLRDKLLSPADLVPFGRYLRGVTAEYGAQFIVNDDPHLAELLDADGCHLGWDDMSVDEARAILGDDKIIGLSTHDRDQVLAAAGMDIDYIGVGPIFQTNTKQTDRTLLGPEFAGWATRTAGLPVVAIGGVNIGNLAQLVTAGCENVAVIGALNNTGRPTEVVRAFFDILNTPDSAQLR